MKHLTYAIVLALLAHASCIGTINLSYDGLSCEAGGAVQPNMIAYYTQSSSSCSPMNCTKSGVASSYKAECASGPSDVNIYLRNTTLYYGETKYNSDTTCGASSNSTKTTLDRSTFSIYRASNGICSVGQTGLPAIRHICEKDGTVTVSQCTDNYCNSGCTQLVKQAKDSGCIARGTGSSRYYCTVCTGNNCSNGSVATYSFVLLVVVAFISFIL